MSETNNKKRNAAIAYGEMKESDKGIVIEQGNYGPSKNEINNLAGMEIKVEGYEIVLDEKSGKLLRVQDNRTINEIIDDKNRRKILEAMKKKDKNEKTGIEH